MTFDPTDKAFAEQIESALKAKIEERNQRMELAWVKLASAINDAGNHKANLDAARISGEDLFDLAQRRRTSEAIALSELYAVINLIAEEGGTT